MSGITPRSFFQNCFFKQSSSAENLGGKNPPWNFSFFINISQGLRMSISTEKKSKFESTHSLYAYLTARFKFLSLDVFLHFCPDFDHTKQVPLSGKSSNCSFLIKIDFFMGGMASN